MLDLRWNNRSSERAEVVVGRANTLEPPILVSSLTCMITLRQAFLLAEI